MTPRSVLILSRSHMLLSSDLQCAQSPHSPVNTGRAWSPGFRWVTPSPTLSTILNNKINSPNYKQRLINEIVYGMFRRETYPPASWPNIRGNNGVWPCIEDIRKEIMLDLWNLIEFIVTYQLMDLFPSIFLDRINYFWWIIKENGSEVKRCVTLASQK